MQYSRKRIESSNLSPSARAPGASFRDGLSIRDLKDMLELKFYDVDEVEIKKFWGIN